MLQPQVFSENLHPSRRVITPASVNRYNAVARRVFNSEESPNVVVWSSMPSLVEEDIDTMADGLHLPARALKQATLMLLNAHCNDNMNYNDGSCCKSSNKPTNLQIIFFAFIGLWSVSLIIQ